MKTRLGMKIRKLREGKRMTQRELAMKARVTPAYVAQLETGRRANPSSEVLQRVAAALGVAPADLHPGRRLMDPREVLRRLKLGEVLREAALGGRTWEWFEDNAPKEYSDPHRASATRELIRWGLIEKIGGLNDPRRPRTYRPTAAGRRFFEEKQLSSTDWLERCSTRIRFPEEPG